MRRYAQNGKGSRKAFQTRAAKTHRLNQTATRRGGIRL